MGRTQEELPIKENVSIPVAYPADTEFHTLQKHQEQLWFGRAQFSAIQGP